MDYQILLRGNERLPIFPDKEDYENFQGKIQEMVREVAKTNTI
jgi:hypothetical protein